MKCDKTMQDLAAMRAARKENVFHAVLPPSTVMTVPVTRAASGPNR